VSGEHAFCSPSDWEGWSNCPGKPALEEFEPETTNIYAEEGTQAHDLAAALLRGSDVQLPVDLADGIRIYVAAVKSRVKAYEAAGAASVVLLVEQKLDISVITAEKDAKGTADAVIIAQFADHSVLDVWDLKFGMGVRVDVQRNGQLQIYGLAALIQHSLLHNFTEVNLVIHQPRIIEAPSEWQTTPDDLYIFGKRVTEAAALSLSLRGEAAAVSNLKAGEKQCRFCKVKHRCPELAKAVNAEVFGDFQALNDPEPTALLPDDTLTEPAEFAATLGQMMARIPLIEAWCTAIRAKVEKELVSGNLVPGFKLVRGRAGPRSWSDRESVEMVLLGNGVEDIYEPQVLKSPTQLEAALKELPVWATLKELTRRSDPKPSVAPDDDPRPQTSLAASPDDFDTYTGEDLV
jgi:uncharacterized protein DUF2800